MSEKEGIIHRGSGEVVRGTGEVVRGTGEVVGLIEHEPREGTLFAGCMVRKIGLATFEIELENDDDLLLVKVSWPTHTVMVVCPSEHPLNVRHIVTYGPTGKPHVSPACPFTAKLVARHGARHA